MNTSKIRKQIIKLIKSNLDDRARIVMKKNKNYLSFADMKFILVKILYYESVQTLRYMFEESPQRYDLLELMLSFKREKLSPFLISELLSKNRKIDMRSINIKVGIYLAKEDLISNSDKCYLMGLMLSNGPVTDDWHDLSEDHEQSQKVMMDYFAEILDYVDLNAHIETCRAIFYFNPGSMNDYALINAILDKANYPIREKLRNKIMNRFRKRLTCDDDNVRKQSIRKIMSDPRFCVLPENILDEFNQVLNS